MEQRKAPGFRTRRRFDYDRRLLPNQYLAHVEPEELDDPRIAATLFTGLTIGYPAWNLLYYALMCTLPGPDPDPPGFLPAPLRDDAVVIETGTNRGISTIMLAQVLKDVHLDTVVHTVENNEQLVKTARWHVRLAGLTDYVDFNVGDATEFLSKMVEEKPGIDFVFLDDNHSRDHLLEEFSIVHPALVARRGIAYFDNTTRGGVAEALDVIKAEYDGNLVRFDNCSWNPPGNAIWQPD